MAERWFSRTERLIGAAGVARLQAARVAIFGVGGVGSYVAEGLVRAGVGSFLLVDADAISLTNVNRQIHATTETVGKQKTAAMAARMREIHPAVTVDVMNAFYLPERADAFFAQPLDYIVDAVDTVAAKLSLVLEAQKRGIPIISSMGAGNKLDPTRFRVADIYRTKVCPLARVMRKELKARGVPSLKVVYSEEPPIRVQTMWDAESVDRHAIYAEAATNTAKQASTAVKAGAPRRAVPGSISFVPSVVGLIIAGEVTRDLLGIVREKGEGSK